MRPLRSQRLLNTVSLIREGKCSMRLNNPPEVIFIFIND